MPLTGFAPQARFAYDTSAAMQPVSAQILLRPTKPCAVDPTAPPGAARNKKGQIMATTHARRNTLTSATLPVLAPIRAPILALVWLLSAQSALAQTAPAPQTPAPQTLEQDHSPTTTAYPAGPAMWVVADDDTTIYLFGTHHVLNPATQWLRPGVQAAFDASSVVYFEADTKSPVAQGEAMQLTIELGRYPPGETLADHMTPDGYARMAMFADRYGLPVFMLNNMRPWMASLTVSITGVVAQGGDPEAGAEAVLEPMAEEAGKHIRYFETASSQVRMIAGIPDAAMLHSFEIGLEYMEEEPNWAAKMEAIWAAGDAPGLADEMYRGLAEAPEVEDAMLTQRNKAWVVEIVRVLEDEPGVFFVAVGAGHLVGDKAVQVFLAEEGYASQRQ